MQTKLSQLKAAYSDGDMVAALRIAARFADLGDHREPITRAWAAHQNPRLYREMGHDPESLFSLGIQALRERYAL